MAEKRTQKPRDVNYNLVIVDNLPEFTVQRRSPLEDQIEKIVAEPRSHGKFVMIADYANGSAASAAANVLRKRHGDRASVEGFTVKPARIEDENGLPRTGLFIKYDPASMVEGEREQFDARLKAREEKVLARRAEREAEKATEKATKKAS